MLCHEIKHVQGIMRQCLLPDHHTGEHQYTKVVDIRLSFDHFILNNTKGGAIDDDQIENVTQELNDQLSEADGCQYSPAQVKRGLWKFLTAEIDELQENLEERFFERLKKLGYREQARLLGEPEIDLKEEAKLEHGDRRYDEARGN